jgi:LCP family protein required for cell wall assembly
MPRLIPLLMLIALLLVLRPAAAQDTPEPIPDALPLVDEAGQDIVNILLMGSATSNPANPGLSDSLLIVSVNRTAGAVSVVSIPRDLYVYHPGQGMYKINTAYYYGETQALPGGGWALLLDTIRYNLGLEIDFYARVNFDGFRELIDLIGGIEITVDCALRDWRLKSPELDPQDAANWERFTLEAGRWTMDSDLALWYVRSRKTSSDLDRGRRQQDVLRAVWRKLKTDGRLEQIPALWESFGRILTTNLTLPDVLGMAPLALSLDTADVEYYLFRQKHEVENAISPAGQQVLQPIREGVQALMQNVVHPPGASRARTPHPTVWVVDAGAGADMTAVAADRLELEGLRTMVLDETSAYREFSHVVDYSGATKGSPLERIQRVLRVTDDGVEITPDAAREVDFKVYVGEQYRYWSCTRDVIQPTPDPPSG